MAQYIQKWIQQKKKEENQHFLPVFLARPLFRPFALLLALASPLFLAPFIFCNFCCCCFFFFLFSQQTRSFIPSASFAFRFERLQMVKGWSGDSWRWHCRYVNYFFENRRKNEKWLLVEHWKGADVKKIDRKYEMELDIYLFTWMTCNHHRWK